MKKTTAPNPKTSMEERVRKSEDYGLVLFIFIIIPYTLICMALLKYVFE